MSAADPAPPLIYALIDDLFFSVRVAEAARRLGFRVRLIERAAQVAPDDPAAPGPAAPPGEPLEGQAAALIAQMADQQPALVIVDLNNQAVPWERWISAMKSSPATRRTPVLAFGSHMDVATQARAKQVGADQVLAKSRFVQNLPGLLEKHARVPDRAALAGACAGDLSARAVRGLELFRAGEYFEAHEELEHAWNEEPGPARELYRAVLQIAVAYLQITRRNYAGALKMFLRARQWLDPLPEVCRGVQVGKLRRQAQRAREALEALGAGRLAEFDLSLLQPPEWEGRP